MSPEQTRGQAVDKRADIWAFGCVLFEMLAGKRAFGGQSLPAVFASICEREPDWAALPSATPGEVRKILQRCLCKELNRRLRDIGEARILLEELTRDYARTQEMVSADRPRNNFPPAATGGTGLGLTATSASEPIPGPTVQLGPTSPNAGGIQVGVNDFSGPPAASDRNPTAQPFKGPSTRQLQVAQAPAAPPARGGGKLLLVVGLVFLLSLGAGAYVLFFMQGKSHSVGVLVFDAPETDPGLDDLANRLTAEVTNQLTKIPRLKVAHPSEIAKLKRGINPRDAGRQLGADAVLKGAVSKQGGVVSFSVELIDVETGDLLYRSSPFSAKEGDVPLSDWTSEIAKAVRNRLANR
jgi:TolB-like protein